MIDDILNELRQGMEKAHVALKRDLAKLRTGRDAPRARRHPGGLLRDTPTSGSGRWPRLQRPEPRLITGETLEKSQVKAVEKALKESDIGLNPAGRRPHPHSGASP